LRSRGIILGLFCWYRFVSQFCKGYSIWNVAPCIVLCMYQNVKKFSVLIFRVSENLIKILYILLERQSCHTSRLECRRPPPDGG